MRIRSLCQRGLLLPRPTFVVGARPTPNVEKGEEKKKLGGEGKAFNWTRLQDTIARGKGGHFSLSLSLSLSLLFLSFLSSVHERTNCMESQ